MASLQPVGGPAREVHAALRAWLRAPDPEPLTVRTSGSTGEPKDVLLGRAAVLASAHATLQRLGGPGRWLLALPAQHVAGLQVLVRSLVAERDPVLLDEHAGFEAAAGAMPPGRRYVSLVPTQLARLLDGPFDGPSAVAALRGFDAVLLGGAAPDPALLERAVAAGVRVVTTYGMSETCGGCVYDGLPLDGVEVEVADDGRIHVRGPVLFDGYAGEPERTARVLVDGALRTSDLGAIDADGRLVVAGRADDVVVSGGVNVGLAAVEARVRAHPRVRDAAVVGVADAEWGTRVAACVVADAACTLDELRAFVAEQLPRSWAPRELTVVPELPLLDNGKVDRQALRGQHESERDR